MLPSRGYFSSMSCPFYISGNCDRPHCHYRHCKTPTKEYDDAEPIGKRLHRIQATLSHEMRTHFEEEKIRSEKEGLQNIYSGIPHPSGNNRPSNGDYYKRHIPVVYAPAKPTIVRRSSQYVPSVPQNCARPSNINYTPSSRHGSNPASEYKPQSTTRFDDSVSYKPSPPTVRNPNSSYTPSQTGRSDPSVSYTPSTTVRTNSDSFYTPSQTGKSYPTASYSPSPTLRTNTDAMYAPKGSSNITASYSPSPSTNSCDASYSPSGTIGTNDSANSSSLSSSYTPTQMVKSSSTPISKSDESDVPKVKNITDAQTSPINSPKRDEEFTILSPKTSLKSEFSDTGINTDPPKNDHVSDEEKDMMDVDKNIEKTKHKEKKSSEKKVKKEHSKREETSDSKKKSKSSSEKSSKSKEKEVKSKSSKDSKSDRHAEKSKSSDKKVKSESKDSSKSNKDKSIKKEGHSSKNDKKPSKDDKDKTNGHSKSTHSKSSKSSHHKSEHSHKSSEKEHKSTEKKHSTSRHRHSSSKSDSSRHKHSSSSKSSSFKRSSSTEDDLKIKKLKLDDHILIEEDSDDDNQGQVICLDSEDDECNESDDFDFASSNHMEEEQQTPKEAPVENSVDRWVKARETINRNSQGRVRIAHVPNVSSLLSAKQMIMSRNSRNQNNRSNASLVEKTEPEVNVDAVQPKIAKRVAHAPKPETLKYPTVRNDSQIRINLFTRQTCLRNLFDEFVKHIREEDASKMAIEEEFEIAKRMNIPKTYQNSVALLVLKIRKNKGIIDKNTGPVVEILSSNSIPSFTYGHTIYKCCLNYLVSDEELKRNGFPQKIKGRPGYAKFDTTLTNRFPEKQEGTERVCINCSKSYSIDDNGLPIMNDECVYHWGRIFKSKVGGNWTDYYSCCNRDVMMTGCEIGAFHLSNTFDWNALGGFVSTSPPPLYVAEDEAGVYALDCEMCHTTRGSELTRCTVIDLNGNIKYDAIVRPENTILDYCTRFSGITEEIMSHAKARLTDVQSDLLDIFNSNTILIGHSLENDLKALRIFHDRIIDTSIMFPHKQGFPYKKALKTLTKEFLGREIQVNESGHDSKEDAIACLDLLMYKIKQDSKVRKPRVIISLPS